MSKPKYSLNKAGRDLIDTSEEEITYLYPRLLEKCFQEKFPKPVRLKNKGKPVSFSNQWKEFVFGEGITSSQVVHWLIEAVNSCGLRKAAPPHESIQLHWEQHVSPCGRANNDKQPKPNEESPPKLFRRPPPERERLETIYGKTATQIEQWLVHHAELRAVLVPLCPGVLEAEGERVWVSLAARQGEADLLTVFKSIKNALPSFRGEREAWDGLALIVGGLLVFAVHPEWVLQHRPTATQRAPDGLKPVVDVPELGLSIPIEGQEARFVSLLVAAVAEGVASLEHLFGKPNPHHWTVKLPEVRTGTLKSREILDLKIHLIGLVLSGTVVIDFQLPEEQLTQIVNDHYPRVLKAIEYAYQEDRDPYFATDPQLRHLSREDLDQLGLEHVLLLIPRRPNETDKLFLHDPTFLFSHAHRIFQSIEAARPRA